jgi:hypothetical protein
MQLFLNSSFGEIAIQRSLNKYLGIAAECEDQY